MILKQVLSKTLHFLQCYGIPQRHMKCCNLVKAKRMCTMKLSMCCCVTRKDTRANFCFGCHYLNFMKNLRQSKLCICFIFKGNEHLSTDTATLQKLKIYLEFAFSSFLVTKNKFQTQRLPKFMLHATYI